MLSGLNTALLQVLLKLLVDELSGLEDVSLVTYIQWLSRQSQGNCNNQVKRVTSIDIFLS